MPRPTRLDVRPEHTRPKGCAGPRRKSPDRVRPARPCPRRGGALGRPGDLVAGNHQGLTILLEPRREGSVLRPEPPPERPSRKASGGRRAGRRSPLGRVRGRRLRRARRPERPIAGAHRGDGVRHPVEPGQSPHMPSHSEWATKVYGSPGLTAVRAYGKILPCVRGTAGERLPRFRFEEEPSRRAVRSGIDGIPEPRSEPSSRAGQHPSGGRRSGQPRLVAGHPRRPRPRPRGGPIRRGGAGSGQGSAVRRHPARHATPRPRRVRYRRGDPGRRAIPVHADHLPGGGRRHRPGSGRAWLCPGGGRCPGEAAVAGGPPGQGAGPRHALPGEAAGEARGRAASAARPRHDRLRHLHARSGGSCRHVEPRGRADQGVSGRRDHRPALLPLLPAGCRRAGLARTRTGRGGCGGPLRGRGLAAAEGRLTILGQRRHHGTPGRAGRAAGLLEDHQGLDGADAGRGVPAPERGAVPAHDRGRLRLRHLHARPERPRRHLERRGRADQAVQGRRDHRATLLEVLPAGGARPGLARPRIEGGRSRRTLRGRRVAGPQGRVGVLGQRGHHGHQGRPGSPARLLESHP